MTTRDHFTDFIKMVLGMPLARTPKMVLLAFSIWESIES